MIRNILFQVHLWAGLVLSLPFALLGLTGSVLVFGDDIAKALNPRPAIHASAGPAQPLDAIAHAALEGAPKGVRLTNLMLPKQPGDPAVARIGRGQRGGGGGGGESVSVDPATLQILARDKGGQGAGGVIGILHRLHANLMIDGQTGRNVIGLFGIGMCLMGISGLVLWWPRPGRWKSAFSIRRGAKGYLFNRDLHGMLGIWILTVFLAVSFSGVYLAYPKSSAAAVRAVLPGRDLRSSANAIYVEPVEGARRADLDRVAVAAEQAAPGARLMSIAPAGRPDQPTRVGLTPPGWQEGAPFITVYANPYTGEVIEVRDPRRYTPGETVQAWQHALHAGEGLGIVWKILVFLSGLTPAVFVFTGVYMWLTKRKARTAAETAQEELAQA